MRTEKGWLIKAVDSGLSDPDEVRRLYIYDKATGTFIRRITIGQRAKAGSKAGSMDRGRNIIRFRGRSEFASRLAWLYEYGKWPDGYIDHINGIKCDDRIENLRDVDSSTNLENQRKARSDNKLGILGVRKKGNRYESRIWLKGKAINIGTYSTPEDAYQAYVEEKRKIHKGCTI